MLCIFGSCLLLFVGGRALVDLLTVEVVFVNFSDLRKLPEVSVLGRPQVLGAARLSFELGCQV